LFIFVQTKTNQKTALYMLLASFAMQLKRGESFFAYLFFNSKTSAQLNKGKVG